MTRLRLFFLVWLFSLSVGVLATANAVDMNQAPVDIQAAFQKMVPTHLTVPSEQIPAYIHALDEALKNAEVQIDSGQYLVMVDRNPNIQMAMLFWGDQSAGWQLIGAAPVSTGLPGAFDHFLTPLGVFNHSLDNPDFRSEGTKNELGFRGYGEKGMRVYDFGWVEQARGWGSGEKMPMRLQMHSTDPQLAEHLLGIPRSKGCIRIPAGMNQIIDRYGLFDADYDEALKRGIHFWVLRADRLPTTTPGRYLVVIDSNTSKRPAWTAAPKGVY